jgi:hypothetical protein
VTLVKLTLPPDTSKRRPAEVVLGVEDGGASAAGSTYYKTMRRCPREHALLHVAGLRPQRRSEALTVGWLFHHALEAYYRSGDEKAAWEAIQALAHEPGYEETYPAVERMVGSYLERYRHHDRWQVLAVEETLAYQDKALSYSARLDLVVHDKADDRLWLVEHKTARTITADLLSGYQMDMQILGQVWLFNRCVDVTKYPKLAGVRVNITTKAAAPKHERVEVYPSKGHLDAFEESLRGWASLVPEYAKLGWPKALGNCTGPVRYFGTCDFFDLCHGRPEATVAQIAREEPPIGFDRKVGPMNDDE